MGEKTWVVVANSSHARLFKMTKFPKIEELMGMVHPESRLRSKDLGTERPGRTNQRGGVTKHAYVPRSDLHELEEEKFARMVGEYLCSCYQKGEFNRLYLIAGPTFLGLLRPHLDGKVNKCVIAEVNKDMTERPLSEIEKHIQAA